MCLLNKAAQDESRVEVDPRGKRRAGGRRLLRRPNLAPGDTELGAQECLRTSAIQQLVKEESARSVSAGWAVVWPGTDVV